MHRSQFDLLLSRRLAPLLVTQFLGAFNDNLFKNAMVVLITYVLAARSDMNAQVLVTLAAGVFIMPFFLFSATAGLLADRFDKAKLIRWTKIAEIGIMLMAAFGLYLGSVTLLMAVLFLTGTQSAFFGPAKYAILPDHLKEDQLVGANALVETSTFLAILLGTLVGGMVVMAQGGVGLIAALVLIVAAGGWLASTFIPAAPAAAPGLRIRANIVEDTLDIMRHARKNRVIFQCILGISWFWLVGATFLSQFPTLAKDVVGGNEQVVTLFLVAFSLGVGAGSLMCNRLLKGAVHATYVPLGAVGITLFSVDLFFAVRAMPAPTAGTLLGMGEFLSTFAGWRILIDLILVAAAGGIYIVPLNAMLQARSEEMHRARNIASNNVINAAFMAVSAVVTILLLEAGFTVPRVFLVVAGVNAAVVVYICQLLPGALVKAILAWTLELLYRVEVRGLQNFEKAGERVVIVANHLSFLDALLISAFVPGELAFAIDTGIARNRFIRFFLSFAKTYPLDPTNPFALRSLIDCVKRGEKVVIFPEGRITVTGALMKIYEGPGMIADKAGALVLPVRLDGAQYTPFSRLRGKVRIRWFPKIRVRFLEPRAFAVPPELAGRRRRQAAGAMLHDLMTEMIFESSDYRRTLFQSLLDAGKTHGADHIVLEDIERKPLGYRRVIMGSFVLGRKMARNTARGEHVGVLLPNASGAVVAFFGLLAHGRVPALLNFSTGAANVVLGCRAAGVKTAYSSRRFVELGKLGDMVKAMEEAGTRVIYLEDVRKGISVPDKLYGLLAGRLPHLFYCLADRKRDPESPAVILFTSGTEGAPKAVVLSHRNVQANRYQVASRIDFGPTDIVLNALPMFHSFGLTCGTLLPLLFGLRTFLYPSPLHYRIIPEVAYGINATLLFGTDTFLAGYARHAHPYDFYSVRYVCAGAEKLKDETRRVYSDRFGVRIFEGYGATETAPVLTMNTPMQNRPGTLGRLMPGIKHMLEAVPGIEDGGKLWVSGPNIMSGYLRVDNPGVLEPPADGWYDTGDVVSVDGDGFLVIKGRVKRFAKIGGEMVSLAAVEGYVSRLWPGFGHAVVALPDGKKGEQLVLVTENETAERNELAAFFKQEGIGAIAMPKDVVRVRRIPLLGSGKTDYRAVKSLVENSAGGTSQETMIEELGRE